MSCISSEFKNAMRLYPASVAVIATGEAPARVGMTATAVCSLSAEPPQLLVCLNSQTTTSKVIEQNRSFSINLLQADQMDLAARFAGMVDGISGDSKFEEALWNQHDAEDLKTSIPVLNSALLSFPCRLVSMHQAGTHQIVVGQVDEILKSPQEKMFDQTALIYGDGAFGTFAPFPAIAEAARA